LERFSKYPLAIKLEIEASTNNAKADQTYIIINVWMEKRKAGITPA